MDSILCCRRVGRAGRFGELPRTGRLAPAVLERLERLDRLGRLAAPETTRVRRWGPSRHSIWRERRHRVNGHRRPKALPANSGRATASVDDQELQFGRN